MPPSAVWWEQRVSTTYVTGTLTSLAVDAASELLARWKKPGPVNASPERGSLPLLLGIWTTYAGGALAGGFAQQQWGFWAVALPAVVLATMAAWDLSQTS